MFERILIALDLDYLDHIEKTKQAAFALGGDKALYQLVTVLPPLGGSMVSSFLPVGYEKKIMAGLQERLHEVSALHFAGKQVKHIVAHGTVYEEISQIADKEHSDVIVVITGKSKGQALGPNAARIARYSHKPVFIIR
ncbi:MAG: universal stress protein [Cardiobacteriaceae bacterium]|nr:universal stress protein [Cardiobacteriaceae bacterium]